MVNKKEDYGCISFIYYCELIRRIPDVDKKDCLNKNCRYLRVFNYEPFKKHKSRGNSFAKLGEIARLISRDLDSGLAKIISDSQISLIEECNSV